MIPRFIELKNAQYRIQQAISEGASGKVFLAKRRPRQIKELLIQIDSTKTDFACSQLEKTQFVKKPKQIADHQQTKRGEAHFAQNSKQQGLLQIENPKFITKNIQEPTQLTSNNQYKTNELWPGEPCAIKCICLQQKNQLQILQQDYWREIQMLEQLKFPGIVSVLDHGIIQDQKKKELFIVLEWGIGGSFSRLVDLVHERSHLFQQREQIFRFYSAQLVETISYLQSRGVSHRDIKAQNLILDKNYRLRLIDFGVAQIFDKEKANFQLNQITQRQPMHKINEAKVYIGSVHHLSPEMIERSRECKDLHIYSKTDIWSLGVVLYYMLTRTYPFKGINTFDIVADYDKICDPLLVALLKRIFQKIPAKRADISQIKTHQYFKGINFKKIFQVQSPILKIVRCSSEQYFYTGEALVRISKKTESRVVGIFRRSSLSNHLKHQSINRKGIVEPPFNKNESQVTESNSEKFISSQYFLQAVQGHMNYKYFLSIAKKEAKSIPKHLQIDKNTKISISKLRCVLLGVKFNVEPEVQEPQSVEIQFSMQQQLDKFVTRFGEMFGNE